MEREEVVKVLASLHDRGLLVPFIGSGMSIGPCVSWKALITNLEQVTSIPTQPSDGDLPARAEAVMQVLRRGAFQVPDVIRRAVYDPAKRGSSTHSDSLAKLRWPLICTTNYDDVYLRAALTQASAARRRTVPRVLGRSDQDCHGVLQHLGLPTGELLWCLQGFLTPEKFSVPLGKKGDLINLSDCLEDGEDLSSEIVLSHSEYRSVTHRMPHFRRCFAEVFRSRSLLFLGSGLTETYFRSLFDEVVELVGPSSSPHFALVKKGNLDAEFMLAHYHTILIEYEADKDGSHSEVGKFILSFAETVESQRVRSQAWGWTVAQGDAAASTPARIDDMTPDFSIVRAPLPLQKGKLRLGDMIGVSCGRRHRKKSADEPMPGVATKTALEKEFRGAVAWNGDYLVSWAGSESWLRGIVARDPMTGNSRDARSPGAVYTAFTEFLADAQKNACKVAFVQLLSSGYLKTFESWMSLVQMARAYGRWAAKQKAKGRAPLKVVVHLYRNDEVVALMNGGYLDIAEHLADAPMRLFIETIDTAGRAQRRHSMVDAEEKLKNISPFRGSKTNPAIHAVPVPKRGIHPLPLSEISDATLSSLGLVSGSTLVADYRPKSIAEALKRAQDEVLAATKST